MNERDQQTFAEAIAQGRREGAEAALSYIYANRGQEPHDSPFQPALTQETPLRIE
jgi:hypothetical protein